MVQGEMVLGIDGSGADGTRDRRYRDSWFRGIDGTGNRWFR